MKEEKIESWKKINDGIEMQPDGFFNIKFKSKRGTEIVISEEDGIEEGIGSWLVGYYGTDGQPKYENSDWDINHKTEEELKAFINVWDNRFKTKEEAKIFAIEFMKNNPKG